MTVRRVMLRRKIEKCDRAVTPLTLTPLQGVQLTRGSFPMRPTTHFLLALILYLIVQWPVPADAQLTADGCSCDLVSRYNPQSTDDDRRDGAEVVGATSCFMSPHRGREWCSFDVVTQRGDSASEQRHREVVRQLWAAVEANNMDRVVEDLQAEFARAFEARPGAVRNRVNLPTLLQTLSVNQTVLYSCARAFVPGGGGRNDRLATTTAGDFGCGVHFRGWLTLFFSFDGSSLFYLLAPLDG